MRTTAFDAARGLISFLKLSMTRQCSGQLVLGNHPLKNYLYVSRGFLPTGKANLARPRA